MKYFAAALLLLASNALAGELLARALDGALKDHPQIVFATRTPGADPHWYANFGYWSEDENRAMYVPGGRLMRLDLRSGKTNVLLEDAKGTIRDPSTHSDGKRIVFSWRKGESKNFNLWEINSDGSGLRQLTHGEFDDIEPAYLPGGDIVFCSGRAKRWVSCWYTQVAVLHRCDKDGKNVRNISGNIEHDNTPAVMNDGRLLYTRWEYVDRSQVEFHHLWSSNPDGTAVQTWFGNMHPGVVMIDAKAIPDSHKVAAVYSHGHGRTEHVGDLKIVSPESGPDMKESAAAVKGCPPGVRDPFVINESLFVVAKKNQIVLVDGQAGASEVLYTDKQELHEPSVLMPRKTPPVIPDRADWSKPMGRLILSDITRGRNMAGVKEGEITKLLVLEALPKPVNFSGGPAPLTFLGTFNLERVLGTVPVEPDGSAFMEVPANRSLVLVALDKNDLSVKRMQSFVSVMPGETMSCAGCHEQRTQTPPSSASTMALRRRPSAITPFETHPDVLDFPRDIQPILNAHCVKCHNYDKPDGGIVLEGDRGAIYSQSYWTLIAADLVADGKNAYGNRPPRSIGSSASRLMKMIDGSHYGVKLPAKDWRTVWLWIESGAVYAGTYASLGTGMVGVGLGRSSGAFEKRCGQCHAAPVEGKTPPGKVALPAHATEQTRVPGRAPHERVVQPDMIRRASYALYNLTRPEKSIVLLAPLAKDAGGWGSCREIKGDGSFGEPAKVFASKDDPDYRRLLERISASGDELNRIKRFDMPGFVPNAQYLREMKRYGILPAAFDPVKDKFDVYEIDQAYWRSLWFVPEKR